jgi:UDPglucose 6-dehydrogenase
MASIFEYSPIPLRKASTQLLNRKASPIEDAEIEDFLQHKPLNFRATGLTNRALLRCET